jgi:hypothetical protein
MFSAKRHRAVEMGTIEAVRFACKLSAVCDSSVHRTYTLSLSLKVCRNNLCTDNFDSIYKKYVEHFYL